MVQFQSLGTRGPRISMNAVATGNSKVTHPLDGFVPVQVHALRTTGAGTVDLFVQYEAQCEPVLYCRAGNPPSADQFAELEAAGVENFYVRSGDFCNFSNDLLSSLDALLRKPGVAATEKFAALQLAVAVAVEQTLRLVDCGKFRALAEKVSDDLVALLGDGDVLVRELYRMARHDFNTFTHLTNVSSYCIILAQKLGIKEQFDLRKIAAAAMLHDVGKRFIPAHILTKSDHVSAEERAIIETHPARGYTELCQKPGLNFGQLMMVYQHHERVDGSGYPVRILKDEIHPWARILAIVDVFDSMTAKRANGRPATPEHVLDYQRQQAGKQFDGEFVECWISAMTKA
jgi:HD-GYP domain-containing protein (c-di-GMP phosphodiesterase class II)